MKLGLMGDVMIGRLVNDELSRNPSHSIWGSVAPLLEENDYNLCNLETALTTSNRPLSKVFTFKADPEKVKVIKEGNIHAVNLANNHTLDFSQEGFIETLATLDAAGILRVGAGYSLEEAKKPVILKQRDFSVAIFGYTDNEPHWIAGTTKPGTNYIHVGNSDVVIQDIAKVRQQVDVIIVTIHWGPNMVERPSSQFVRFAHSLIDHGVAIIHGHSAHIFQGIERYKNGLILYDTGDFVDDYAIDPKLRNDRSFLFVVELEKEGIKHLRLVPVRISDFQVNRSAGNERKETIERMKFLSQEFHTVLEEENGELHLFF